MTPSYYEASLARLRREQERLLRYQTAEQAAATKSRSAALKKAQQAQRSRQASTVQRLRGESTRAQEEALKHDRKAVDYGKRLTALAAKINTSLTRLAQAQAAAARADRRRAELAEARQRFASAALPVIAAPAPSPEPLRVAFLTASPTGEERVRVDREVRAVRDAVRRGTHSDDVDIDHWPAATFDDVAEALKVRRPHVVHFSGHGNAAGLFFDGTEAEHPDGVDVDFQALAQVLAQADHPPTVLVLNACKSFAGAETLLAAVPVVIAMVDEISDVGANAFATKLYAAVANGDSLGSALTQASQILTALTDEGDVPDIVARPGIDPNELVLVTATED